MNAPTIRAALAAATMILAGAACSDDEGSTDPTESPSETTGAPAATDVPAGDASVTIAGFAFGQSAPIAAGVEFFVANDDGAPHTMTESGGAFTFQIGGGSSVPAVIADAGTYEVFCEIHEGMFGSITVD